MCRIGLVPSSGLASITIKLPNILYTHSIRIHICADDACDREKQERESERESFRTSHPKTDRNLFYIFTSSPSTILSTLIYLFLFSEAMALLPLPLFHQKHLQALCVALLARMHGFCKYTWQERQMNVCVCVCTNNVVVYNKIW